MRNFGLSVGMNYPNGPEGEKLEGSVNGAVQFHCALLSMNFKKKDATLLIDDPPSGIMRGRKPTQVDCTVILGHLNLFSSCAKDGDSIFFFFSGHCGKDYDGHPYIFTGYNKDGDEEGIYDYDFEEMVKNIPQGVSFNMFVDGCDASGILPKVLMQYPGQYPNIKDLLQTRGIVFTSDSSADGSYEHYVDEWKCYGSAFSWAVVKALKTSKGKIKYIDLIEMIHRNVQEIEAACHAKGYKKTEQIPALFCSYEESKTLFLSA